MQYNLEPIVVEVSEAMAKRLISVNKLLKKQINLVLDFVDNEIDQDCRKAFHEDLKHMMEGHMQKQQLEFDDFLRRIADALRTLS